MSDKRQGNRYEERGYQPSRNDPSPVKGGYTPPTSEKAPAPPPKNP